MIICYSKEIVMSFSHLTTYILLILITTIPSSSYSYLFEGISMNCEGVYNCGSIRGIKYPFYGSGLRPRYCGRDDYLLDCRDNRSTFLVPYFSRTKPTGFQPPDFRVLRINESLLQMRLVHNVLWNNICLKSSSSSSSYNKYNTTLISGLRYVTGTTFLKIFYGCSPEVLSGVQVPSNISCSVRGTANTGVFFADEVVEYVQGCSFGILVPLISTAYWKLWDKNITLQEAVNEGFEVDYSDALGPCLACRASGGSCGFDREFLCLCGDTTRPLTCTDNSKSYNQNTGAYTIINPSAHQFFFVPLVIGSSVWGIGILICLSICYTKYRKKFYKRILFFKRKTQYQSLETCLKQCGSLAPKRYNYSDIKKMTHAFKEKLGEGGYGGVYRGNLSDGREVAVKILKEAKGNGEDFINEVASISQTSHVNVVSLLGYCLDGSKRALIYDFMPNGSLEKYIHADDYDHLGLERLYQIAVGIAKGLEYLHRGCNTRILHFDIKPHNILLDEDFCPKISDFGLAKLCTKKGSIVSLLGARGTIGYIAPEVCSRNYGEVSHKSDVYSYGMMILEIVGGRKNVNAEVSHISQIYFPYWAYQHIQRDEDLKLQGITNKEEDETARKMILVGLWCIQTDPARRPSMSKAIDMLEGSLEALEIPPEPLLCNTCSGRHSLTIPGMSMNPSLVSASSTTVGSPTTSIII